MMQIDLGLQLVEVPHASYVSAFEATERVKLRENMIVLLDVAPMETDGVFAFLAFQTMFPAYPSVVSNLEWLEDQGYITRHNGYWDTTDAGSNMAAAIMRRVRAAA